MHKYFKKDRLITIRESGSKTKATVTINESGKKLHHFTSKPGAKITAIQKANTFATKSAIAKEKAGWKWKNSKRHTSKRSRRRFSRKRQRSTRRRSRH